jgi:hypothetical protein
MSSKTGASESLSHLSALSCGLSKYKLISRLANCVSDITRNISLPVLSVGNIVDMRLKNCAVTLCMNISRRLCC